jgi:hypothetical protein
MTESLLNLGDVRLAPEVSLVAGIPGQRRPLPIDRRCVSFRRNIILVNGKGSDGYFNLSRPTVTGALWIPLNWNYFRLQEWNLGAKAQI